VIYGIRKIVETDLTVAAINAQLALLNTLYTLAVPNVVTVADGAVTNIGGMAANAFPAVLHYVGTQPSNGEPKAEGHRDIPDLPLILAVHSKQQDLALARRDCEVTLEALYPIVEGLRGRAFGSTLRQLVNVQTLSASIEEFVSKDGAVIRIGGVMRMNLFARTQGLS
jgi:hypothetical protein